MNYTEDIIYISGSGRSGSTLLERILHSSPGVWALGEFHCLWRMEPSAIACSCGLHMSEDPFWGNVLERARISHRDLAEMARLEAIVCRTGFVARHRFSLGALSASAEVQQFLALHNRLFAAIRAESGNMLLVDSSKAGPRAWIMACDPRVRFIHLYRDPADVIVSWRKPKFDPGLGTEMKRMSIRAAATDWLKVELFARRLNSERDVAMIDYQALCASPRSTTARIMREFGFEDRVTPAWTADEGIAPDTRYHSLNGNPDRFDTGVIRISARRSEWGTIGGSEKAAIQTTAAVLRTICPPPA